MKYLNLFIGNIIYVVLLIAWLAGFVLAKGVWQVIFCIIPFYAWYLVVEKIMTQLGIV